MVRGAAELGVIQNANFDFDSLESFLSYLCPIRRFLRTFVIYCSKQNQRRSRSELTALDSLAVLSKKDKREE